MPASLASRVRQGQYVGVSAQLGPVIGRGRHADVYDLGNGFVLRRYRYERDTAAQAQAMRSAREAGYPVPAVINSDGRDLVMERVEGPTMLQRLVREPWRMRQYAAVLADLHSRLHIIRAPDELESPVGDGAQLIHLDLQPENIVLHPRLGPIVLDWEWAAAGPPSADVAHTWLQVATSQIPGPAWRRVVGWLLAQGFLRDFLACVDREEAARHMAVVREYRLARRELTVRERRAVAGFTPSRK